MFVILDPQPKIVNKFKTIDYLEGTPGNNRKLLAKTANSYRKPQTPIENRKLRATC